MKKAAVPSILVAVVLLAVAVIADEQQPKKVQRIGYLKCFLPFRYVDSHRGIPARAPRAWVR